MKLQLNPAQIKHFADSVSRESGREACAQNIFHLFEVEGHDPFTRKDFNAVLDANGFETDWETLDPIFYALVDAGAYRAQKPDGSNRRGYYTFVDPETKAPATLDEILNTFDPEGHTLATPKVDPHVKVLTAEGEAWVPLSTEPTDLGYYADDLGLRRTAIAESPCYGNWVEGAEPCGRCPLAAFCQTASMADMADIAKALDIETENAIKEANRPKATTPTPIPAVPHEEAAPTGSYPEGAHELEVPFEGICTKCGSGIPEGSLGVHVPGMGMLHPQCARK